MNSQWSVSVLGLFLLLINAKVVTPQPQSSFGSYFAPSQLLCPHKSAKTEFDNYIRVACNALVKDDLNTAVINLKRAIAVRPESANQLSSAILVVNAERDRRNQSKREQQKDEREINLLHIQIANSFVQLLTLFLFLVSVCVAICQMRATDKWNRKKTTHDFLIDQILGPVDKNRVVLEGRETYSSFNNIDSKITFPSSLQEALILLQKMTSPRPLKIDPFNNVGLSTELAQEDIVRLREILNYLEHMAVAIDKKIIVEEIAYECFHPVFIAYFQYATPYIFERREDVPQAWCATEKLAIKWIRKQKRCSDLNDKPYFTKA